MDLTTRRQAGYKIKNRMDDLQISRKVLADRIGVSEMTITRIMNGTTDAPSLEIVINMGKELEFTPNEMATLFGLWIPRGPVEDRRIERAAEVADKLTGADRENFLNFVEMAALNAEINSRRR